ncbi:MAG TPA: thiamine pyrophosphate-binding protein [Actinomycetota bacterium]|nr:thiamine pyrophosphate-binding protein [Actinomycetota bacterium]
MHVARALEQGDVHTIFALPGGHITPLYDGARHTGVRIVGARHEENAVFMAEAWALATAQVGVAAVTAGPGLANALPGMAEANAAGVPVVVIAGRTGIEQRGRGAVQDMDQLAAVAPLTKWRAECLKPERVGWFVSEALHQARAGAPGVAYLEVPQDVLAATTEPYQAPWPVGHEAEPARSVPAPSDLRRAMDLLSEAERPVALAGSGAFFSGAGQALRNFAERTGVPVTTTSAARGLLDDDHPRCLGGLVHGGIALASADVALILGSRFNANVTYGGAPLFQPDQRVVQVDVRPEHLGGWRRPQVALAGDVATTLEALTDAWQPPAEALDGWMEQCREGVASSRQLWQMEGDRPANGIHPGWLAREVARFAREQGPHTFVSDGGDSVLWGIALSTAHAPGTNLFIGSAQGTLGIGLPFGIGAKVARPAEPVFVFTGDGAFGLSAIELDTAARNGAGVVVVVVDNGGWGDVRHEQRMFYGEESVLHSDVSSMRYDLLAQAVGGHGERVEAAEGLRPALERATEASAKGVPAVVDVATDPDAMSDLMSDLSGLAVM